MDPVIRLFMGISFLLPLHLPHFIAEHGPGVSAKDSVSECVIT